MVSRIVEFNLTKQENMLLLFGTETTESKPVKQETRSTVILPLRVSVVWNDFGSNPKRGSNIKTKKKNPP